MNPQPVVRKLTLSRDYKFMYENFVISTQNELLLLLENKGGKIFAFRFDSILYKYGYPNDEGLGFHPMSKFGLRFYGLYQVDNSTWISESDEARSNSVGNLFTDYQHYIVTFKDVTLDVLSKG